MERLSAEMSDVFYVTSLGFLVFLISRQLGLYDGENVYRNLELRILLHVVHMNCGTCCVTDKLCS